MPYRNIVFVKIYWKELLYEDDRFTDKLNDKQKGLYLMLLVLAGATNNNIKDDENYLKRILNLSEKPQQIRQNLNRIFEVFPKCVSRNGYIRFRNFNRLHNPVREKQELPTIAKKRIDDIRLEYMKVKGYREEDFSSDDFNRTAKAIKILLMKANYDDNVVIKSFHWASQQTWADWTLETIIRRWVDFARYKDVPLEMMKYIKKESR